MNHTSGLPYRFSTDEAHGRLYDDAQVSNGLFEVEGSLEEVVDRLASVPLKHQPGSDFTYGLGVDVLGRVIEVASGQTLNAFLADRIFKPLGMMDTHFLVPPKKRTRLATVYEPSADTLRPLPKGTVRNFPFVYAADYPLRQDNGYYSGGGGLVSTTYDYWKFCQMVLNNGELDGVRILSRTTVELMTTDSVDDDVRKGLDFGYGFSLTPEPLRSFWWLGFFNTRFWIDADEEMVGIVMRQLFPNRESRVTHLFRQLSYQTIVD